MRRRSERIQGRKLRELEARTLDVQLNHCNESADDAAVSEASETSNYDEKLSNAQAKLRKKK